MITVTLNQIKANDPCTGGWKKALKANGGINADMDKPFPLVSILDSNDLEDTLWVISNIPEMSDHNSLWRVFSRWCALQSIEKISTHCSSVDYDLIVRWLTTGDESIMEAAWSAADSAARSAQENKLREILSEK